MTEHPDDLLAAVDALTKPVVMPTPIIGDDGKWKHVHQAKLPPLLVQLEEAVTSSMSGKAGGGNPATRNVLDSDALHRLTLIASQIKDWCRVEGVQPTGGLISDLRKWYVARLALPERDDTFHHRKLTEWAGIIETKLDPPRRLEVTEPCPVCEAREWWDTDGDPHPFPIVIEYAEGDADILRTARAVCRSCEHTWHGSSQLRALRYELDAQEETRAV